MNSQKYGYFFFIKPIPEKQANVNSIKMLKAFTYALPNNICASKRKYSKSLASPQLPKLYLVNKQIYISYD